MRTENKLFNPASQPREMLIENFVVRTKVFEKIFKDIEKGNMKYPEQHYLLQGLRGMGKTTLLLRLKYEVEKNEKLNNWLIPVFFNEESYDLSSLSNLWEKLLKYLDDYWGIGNKLYDQTEKFIGSSDYEKLCFDLLIEALHERKQKLLILFDNFGELFLDNLKERETHRFREILMHCNDIRIVAASAIVLEDQHDYSKPFFEFFRIIYLDGLNKDETLDLITKLQEKETDKKIDIEKNKAKIETLALLTGGVIRTILLLYEVLLSDENGTALRDLDIILDRITPLYKHRMDALPVQQRKIVDVVAKSWDAISVKDIASQIREDGKPMQGKAISAQLAQLEKNNVIEKKETSTKNNFYQLRERFFNIWYLMRNGDRYDRCRVIWLTKFLEMWYSDEEKGFENFINLHINRLQKGDYFPDSALLIAQAINNSDNISKSEKQKIFLETKKILPNNLIKELPTLELSTAEEVIELLSKDEYEKAAIILEKTNFGKNEITKLKLIGDIYYLSKNHFKAIGFYEQLRLKNDLSRLYKEAASQFRIRNLVEAKRFLLLDYENSESVTRRDSSKNLAGYIFYEKGNKKDALKFIEEYYKNNSESLNSDNSDSLHLKIIILLWNNYFLEAIELLNILIVKNEFIIDDMFESIILFLIAKKQNYAALDLFKKNDCNFKDRYKPIYYALIYLMKDKYPNEFLKMGSELDPIVKEIIENIHKLAINYA